MQKTVSKTIEFNGYGLHSGKPVKMSVAPSGVNTGIVFVRSDVLEDADDQREAFIPARWDCVEPSQLCTLMRNDDGVTLSTVEHIMAALAGCGICNAIIRVDGPEVPILDGSSSDFVREILAAGIQSQRANLRVLKILKAVEIKRGDAFARLEPCETTEISFHIDFEDEAIGSQQKQMVMSNGAFVKELSNCRTFCRQSEVDWMQENGLALGGVAGENAVVFDGAHVNGGEQGLRYKDEPVRHKMLDALGDLYLAGAPILGRYIGSKSGHAMTNALLRELFNTKGAWVFEYADENTQAKLPGAGVDKVEHAHCA